MKICYVPTLSALSAESGGLFELWRKFGQAGCDVAFGFSICRFLRPQAVAFLGGLARSIESGGSRVDFRWETLGSAVKMNLAQNGFLHAFGDPTEPWKGNSVPYLHHESLAAESFSNYVHQAWLGRGWVGMSGKLADRMTSSICEAYLNAFEHAESRVGVHCCGQYFPNNRVLSLTMVDFGVGVPCRVKSFFATRNPGLNPDPAQCLKWAFQSGTSTRGGGVAGGLGLDTLREFVVLNRGVLEYYSHEARVFQNEHGIRFSNCSDYFGGTMVTVLLRCDDRYYALGSELSSHNPFNAPTP